MVPALSGCPAFLAGEQPAGPGAGGGGVLLAGGQLEEQSGEGLGHGRWRVAQVQEHLAVLLGDVVGGEPDQAVDRLGVQKHQACRDPGAQWPGGRR